MSPLLFVLIMEYLTRILSSKAKIQGMGYHPGCRPVELVSLCFADDLILLSRGTIKSLSLMIEVLNSFLRASGLGINRAKSNLYICGTSKVVKQQIIILLARVNEGSFPLSYLAISLKPTKWTKFDCAKVVDKFRNLISSWGSSIYLLMVECS